MTPDLQQNDIQWDLYYFHMLEEGLPKILTEERKHRCKHETPSSVRSRHWHFRISFTACAEELFYSGRRGGVVGRAQKEHPGCPASKAQDRRWLLWKCWPWMFGKTRMILSLIFDPLSSGRRLLVAGKLHAYCFSRSQVTESPIPILGTLCETHLKVVTRVNNTSSTRELESRCLDTVRIES